MNLPDRNSTGENHSINLSGSKWGWAVETGSTRLDLPRAKLDIEQPWIDAKLLLKQCMESRAESVRLVLTRQFNWPAGVSGAQSVRLALKIVPPMESDCQLDGMPLRFHPESEFLVSDRISDQNFGARRIEFGLEGRHCLSLLDPFPVIGVWLWIG